MEMIKLTQEKENLGGHKAVYEPRALLNATVFFFSFSLLIQFKASFYIFWKAIKE
jgi:hypothetical protein